MHTIYVKNFKLLEVKYIDPGISIIELKLHTFFIYSSVFRIFRANVTF